jgi:hypothetical protein
MTNLNLNNYNDFNESKDVIISKIKKMRKKLFTYYYFFHFQ